MIWWVVFAKPRDLLKNNRGVFPLLILIAFFSGFMELTGGGGVSYGIRMLAILAIGIWLYSDYRKGEFLDLGTWLLGTGIGFDLGMVAEMGMQSIDTFSSDFVWIRRAQKLKGEAFSVRNLLSTGIILVTRTVRRADDTAEVLSVRGYTKGGSYCPGFRTTWKDFVGAIAAVLLVIISSTPASEFFILYR